VRFLKLEKIFPLVKRPNFFESKIFRINLLIRSQASVVNLSNRHLCRQVLLMWLQAIFKKFVFLRIKTNSKYQRLMLSTIFFGKYYAGVKKLDPLNNEKYFFFQIFKAY